MASAGGEKRPPQISDESVCVDFRPVVVSYADHGTAAIVNVYGHDPIFEEVSKKIDEQGGGFNPLPGFAKDNAMIETMPVIAVIKQPEGDAGALVEIFAPGIDSGVLFRFEEPFEIEIMVQQYGFQGSGIMASPGRGRGQEKV
tara:strand:- start:114 stop:542 length:429 start_codon:yes stop_codon:yes gene_type:complete